MDRIKNKFQLLKKQKKKALGIFLTAGYPDTKTSEKILHPNHYHKNSSLYIL